MLVLGIESSCDDTSAALLNYSGKGHVVINEKTASQIDIHQKYGGVVPELAGRAHAEKIIPLIESVLENQQKPEIIAVSAGPGLITGLLVGVEAARSLAYTLEIQLIPINHLEGHIYSVELNGQNSKIEYPAIALIASGGHTELVYINKAGQYNILGKTKDDAAGEAFDKVAKLLSLPYPGGPQISKLAKTGINNAIKFPRPMLNKDNYDFSFAGLKTAALYWLKNNKLATNSSLVTKLIKILKINKNRYSTEDFCASFEQAVVDVLVEKTIRAADFYKPKTVILAGGVSANEKLRNTLWQKMNGLDKNIKLMLPEKKYSMDNAAMIAVAGYYNARKKNYTPWNKITVDPNWQLG